MHPLDLALVALAVVVLVSSLGEEQPHVRYGSATIALATLVLLGRRWHPPAAYLAGFGLVALAGLVTPQMSPVMFVAVLATFGVAATPERRTTALVAWALGCLALLIVMMASPYTQGAGDVVLTLTFCTIVWAAALLAAERGRAAGAARVRASLAEDNRDLHVTEATERERTRIAGELHDIVSHGLSIVVLQTVAARMALEDHGVVEPDVDRRLAAVEETARDALDDMRRLLDLLRPADDSSSIDTTPSAGLRDLPALLERARSAGLPIEAELDPELPELGAGLDTAAYRILQEALTNVLKHASGAPTQVRVRRSEVGLELAVLSGRGNRGADTPPGAGHGLIGMRQRAVLYGGTLWAGPVDVEARTGYAVRAVFPLGEHG